MYTKTGTYSLLMDNFHDYGVGNNGTGTVYIDSANVIPQPQQYTIDWNKVVTNTTGALIYQTDTNNDGIIGNTGDTTINLPPIYQDITPPTTIATLSGMLLNGTTNNYIETVNISLNSTDSTNGSGIYKTYFTLDNYSPIFTEYTHPINVHGLGNYTLKYYSVDKFGNIEGIQTKNFSIVAQPETYSGKISGYVYEDTNNNGSEDSIETTMSGWKICIDKNNNNTCEENIEPFQITNNQGYYEFNGLPRGNYKMLEISHQNWSILSPTTGYYSITLSNGQVVTGKNFGNVKIKGKK